MVMYKIKLLVTINDKFSIYWGINYSLSQIISIYYSSWEINSFLQILYGCVHYGLLQIVLWVSVEKLLFYDFNEYF